MGVTAVIGSGADGRCRPGLPAGLGAGLADGPFLANGGSPAKGGFSPAGGPTGVLVLGPADGAGDRAAGPARNASLPVSGKRSEFRFRKPVRASRVSGRSPSCVRSSLPARAVSFT